MPPPGPRVLWTPPPDVRETTELGRYLAWLERERGLVFAGYDELQRWSVADLPAFWSSIWEFFEVKAHAPYSAVLTSDAMPGARWFPGARLNFAEHLLGDDGGRRADRGRLALADARAGRPDLRASSGRRSRGRAPVSSASASGRATGSRPTCRTSRRRSWRSPRRRASVRSGRAVRPSSGRAASSTGWRSSSRRCSWPSAATATATASVDRRAEVATIRAALPTVRHVVHVPYGEHVVPDAVGWDELLGDPGLPLAFEPVAFDHPLFVLFSSGTTARPKAIVHGHGGILLELLKAHAFSWDLKPGGRLLWYSTTSWMMWNALVAALLVRSSIVMLDGDPVWPDAGWQWRVAEETKPTFMGASPAFLMGCRKAGLHPGRDCDLSSIRVFGTAGSPLPAEGYRYVYEELGPGRAPDQRERRDRRLQRDRRRLAAATRLRRGDLRAACSAWPRRRSTRREDRSSASSASS